MRNKILSVLLTLSIALALMPVPALAWLGPPIPFPASLDLIDGSITIEDDDENIGKLKVGQAAGVYSALYENIDPTTPIVITQTDASSSATDHKITVSANVTGGVSIVLNGVNIDRSASGSGSEGNAFSITYSAGAVNLRLADGSTNQLQSGFRSAGLEKRALAATHTTAQAI